MGCITLLSDFGLQDASVASAKGIITQYLPNANIVDITHLVEPFHLQQAAYLLAATYKNFPEGTFHVLLFDIFSEKTPRLVLCQHNGHYFFSADNGVIALAFGPIIKTVWTCFELKAPSVFRDWLHVIGKTILQLQNTGTESLDYHTGKPGKVSQRYLPIIDGNTVECHVIHIDRYENVIINITKEQFEEIGKGRKFRIQFMRNEEISEINTYYHNVKDGEKLCRFNSTGYLEIAINRGKAASLFGFRLYKEHHLIYNTIKIFFE